MQNLITKEFSIQKSSLAIIIIVAYFTQACQKIEYVPKEPTKHLQWIFTPILQDKIFLFDQNYLINDREVRLTKCTFTTTLQDGFERGILFDETTDPAGASIFLGIWRVGIDSLSLRFYGSREVCEEDISTETQTCHDIPYGSFSIKGKADLDHDGILEKRFEFKVNIEPLKMEKKVYPVDNPEIYFTFDLEKLFDGVDIQQIDRNSTQLRIAENVLGALERH